MIKSDRNMLNIISLLNFAYNVNTSQYEDLNLYDILNVNKYATEKDITKSYKRLLIQNNRNRNPSERAKKVWKQTEYAHDILSNPSSRKLYDALGNLILNQTDFSVFGYRNDLELAQIKKMYRGSQQNSFAGAITFPLQFDLVDFMNGANKNIRIMRTIPCICKKGGQRCPKCRKNPYQQMLVTENVVLPKGASEHHRIYYKELIDSPFDRGASEIIFIAYLKNDGIFTREGVNIRRNITISLPEVVNGGNYTFENPDGEELSISLEGVQHGEERRIRGKGIPYFDDPKTRGDVIVTFFIDFPKQLTDAQKEIVRKNLPDDIEAYA